MRYSFDGLIDKCAKHGEPTGHGPNWEHARAAYAARQQSISRVGTWRKAPAKWKQNVGPYIDPDYYIVDWGQDG